MSSNINRPKSLAGNKFKPPTPLIQNKNVKKRDSFRVQQENNYDNDINDNNQRNSIRLKSHKGNIAQNNNGQLTGYYNGQIQTNNDGLLYFGGNIGGQNSSKSNKRFFTSNVLNSQNSKEYNDQITDEFNDNNIVQKNLQLQLDEINNEACNNVPKLIKQNLNSKNNSAQSTSQSSSTTPISTNGFQQSDNKKSKLNGAQQAGQSKSSKKGEKYISIKDTIAAYKEVEQKLIMKSNDINGRPPLLISTNNQIGISSITPQSITSNQAQNQQLQQNLINSIKQVYSEERLNIIGSSCQQQNIDKKGIPFGVNLNQRPGLNSAANSSSSTTHKNNNPLLNKENSTTGSSFQNSNQATNTIYNYLVNPSAALPPSKINSINVFRIKKQQSSTRSSYNQQTPQQNNYYQLDGNNNFYIQQIFNSQKSKQQNFLNQESDEEQSNEKNNTSFNCYDSNNPKSTTQNQNQLKQKYQLAPQSQITADEFNYQDSSQLDKNSSKLIGSNRYIQNNRQILSAQRPPKGQNKSAAATNQNSTNNTSSMQLNENKKIRFSHAKRNSEKFTGNTINTQSNWSPEASICQQDDASSDEIQLSSKSNRSQSSQSKPNNFSSVDKNEKGNLQSENSQSNSYSKNTDTNQSLQKSSLLLKIQKQNEHCSQILSTINTAEIKPLYWKSQVIDDIANTDYERNILILKAENLLFGGFTSESYWEKKDNQGQINGNGIFGGMINFNGNSSNNIRSTYLNNGNSGYQGDIYSNKLNEIKRILRTLSKHYLIFLLFNSCSKKVRDLVSFMIKQSFSFDGAYYTYNPQSYSIYSNKCVNLQQIIIDYKLQSKVNKIIIFDAVPSNFQANLNQSQFQRNNFRTPAYSTHKKRNLSYQPMRSKSGVINTESEPYLAKDQFQIEQSIEKDDIIKSAQNQNCFKLKKELHFQLLQEFIPKFEEKIIGKAKVVLFKQRINPNLLQANQKKVLEVALSFVDPRISSFSNNLYFLNLDVQDVTAQAYEEGLLNHRKRNFLKEINKVKQQNKNTKEVIELDSDKVAENFRNRLIEYMKSTNKQIHNLYYLVGDLVVRNRNIFQKYYTDPFHCKKKNVDNLLQLDMLRYKPFPKLSKQMYFRGKQAQDYQNLMKQLPQKNPYDILFFPEENINNPYQQKPLENSQIITSQKDQNIETISLDVKQSQNNQIKEINEINIKKKCTAISYNLPFSIYLCMEVQI
ncbi:hypothetical protein TTHERM_00219380 (macronuclear) [Tetrahymena thermophila SB210]|uniref:Uncharacterized protein n=1 Tax=Tetrahymena thermophila (strain SB210) TaxID=312017 RepID=I7LVY9_TETTS|nr:hypothetical protein TTHERM_00219380 [Tetrahymena thermophila SB210]EAS00365.1 hypothetical protein TTHERM_00219380 [Tetrahymena thermophila SB210]|eukprot:XP_001020610.1 hypothetical protein TTHERM_00219380 [Tetrahymena thermophila SB210]